ncbi:probable RNA-binding protein ARP1 isoform X1 [Prosopis cineraria]|uniref:probable RNA-binding protein ARP1 isoform X1 n=1 Tax=Prosopis cineraria TaxID=364024 RepID=UPI00240F9A97|nr:probable RNA-binding protein ARP1 isoform X1 [Prosopis cineraria]
MPEMVVNAAANSSSNGGAAVVNNGHQFGDTTLTKVFVGGLAWETPKDAMREHFQKYGEILEAVIISDKATGRSKGYGFVTFKEAEAAKKACEDPTPIINGRRANCNLASLGARRPRSTNTSPPRQQGSNGGGQRNAQSAPPPPANHVQWYYPVGSPASHFHHHHPHQPVPLYGYTPTYIPTDINYNQKLSYTGGGPYMNGYYSPMYPSQAMVGGGNTMMPMYPVYQYHQTHTVGLSAHIFQPTTAGHVAIMSKPASMTPNTGIVGRGESLKKVG